MNNYSTQLHGLKGEISEFCEKVCAGLGKPQRKLVRDMVFGVSAAQSCQLSEISRALGEEITLKKTVDRLAHGLKTFDEGDTLRDNFAALAKPFLGDAPIFLIDESDLTKPYGKAFEGLAEVRDGSTGECKQGFSTLEIAALGAKMHTPIPVYDRVFSTKEEGFISHPDEIFKGLRWLSKTFGNQGVRVFDRGFDSNSIYHHLFCDDQSFIIRARKNRHLIHKGKQKNILEIATQYKGKCNLQIHGLPCKTSVISVKLPKYREQPLSLVMVYGLGEEPMLLLTNLKPNDSRLSNSVAKAYLTRWRIEENFRFKKQQFGLEGFRVRSLCAIRALHRIVTLLAGYMALLSEQRDDSPLPARLIAFSKRLFHKKRADFLRSFLQYAIADGISALLRRACTPLASPRRRSFGCSAQLALWGF